MHIGMGRGAEDVTVEGGLLHDRSVADIVGDLQV